LAGCLYVNHISKRDELPDKGTDIAHVEIKGGLKMETNIEKNIQEVVLDFIEKQKYEDALKLITKNNSYFQNDELDELKAIIFAHQGKWQNVATLLQRAMKSRGALSTELSILLGNSLIMLGQSDLADQVLSTVPKNDVTQSQIIGKSGTDMNLLEEQSIKFNGIECLENEFYLIRIRAPQKNTRISFDIYPSSDPRHPGRHYGTWVFEVENQNEYFLVLNFKEQKIECGPNVKLINARQYEYKEENHYNIILNEEKSNKAIQRDIVGQYMGPARSLDDVQSLGATRLKSAVWFITWKCNFKCAYCWEVQRIIKGELQPEPYKDYKLWVDAWNKIKPEILDISGGEPFLQPDFIKLLNELDPDIKIAITTNLSFDVVDFVQKVNPDKIISLTFSYHPTQKMSRDQFGGKVLLVKNRGFKNITVNYVTWPEQIWQIEENKNYFEKIIGVRFHVDPYAPTPHFPYEYSDRESRYIQQFVEPNRKHAFGTDEKFDVACSGGVNHISVEPDGSAYRCIQDKVTNKPKIGNILEGDFKLNTKKTFCDQYHICPGCDRDKIDITKLIHNEKTKRVIPIGVL